MPAAPLFTVFTATYNRAATLPRVWESLREQTCQDFEWLIVDDGSTDETRALVEGWAQQSSFPIRYFWQQNQHKKTAINLAAREAHGSLMVPLDSDDRCVPQALERLRWHWLSIDEAARSGFTAVTVLCQDQHGELVGDRFPGGEFCDSTGIEMAHRWKVGGEKWGFQRVDVLRQFPFPEDVRGYLPEAYVWYQIDQHYRTRFVNEALRIYHRDQGDSLISHSFVDPRPFADGWVLAVPVELRGAIPWLRNNPLGLIKLAANLVRMTLHSTLPRERVLQNVWASQPWSVRALMLLTAPIGLAAWLRDRWLLKA